MNHRRDGTPNIVERLGFERQIAEARRATAARRVPQHCWVVDLPQAPGRWPGLLTAWRHEGKAWLGYVTIVADGPAGVEMRSCWTSAEHLRPL